MGTIFQDKKSYFYNLRFITAKPKVPFEPQGQAQCLDSFRLKCTILFQKKQQTGMKSG